jgi:hypothetical protein
MDLKKWGGKRSWTTLKYYSDIRVERLRKATNKLSQVSWPPGQGLNAGPPAYEAEVPNP